MDYNLSVLIGRLTSDPQTGTTAANVPYVRFTLAVGRSYRQADGSKKTDFIDVTAWHKTAEFAAHYLKQGSQILVEGELHTDSYTKENGEKVFRTYVEADTIRFTGGRKEAEEKA